MISFGGAFLGEMLDLDKKSGQNSGVGLSANVLGVLLGGLIGNARIYCGHSKL